MARTWLVIDVELVSGGERGEKNGNSTTIDDRADIAIRALICVLWDEPLDHDLDLAVDFFDTLIQRYAVIRPIRWDSEPDIRE